MSDFITCKIHKTRVHSEFGTCFECGWSLVVKEQKEREALIELENEAIRACCLRLDSPRNRE